MTDEEKAEEFAQNEINKMFVDESEEVYVRASTLKQIIKNSHLKGLAEARTESNYCIELLQNEKAELAEDFCKQLAELKEQRSRLAGKLEKINSVVWHTEHKFTDFEEIKAIIME